MKKKHKKILKFIFIIILLIYIAYQNGYFKEFNSVTKEEHQTVKEVSGDLNIQFLDVGQADAILIQNKGVNMLIDAGNNEDGELLVDYFNELGIDSFAYVVGTHAHEDHIGGMDDIIDNFDVKTFYMTDAVTTTMTYEDVLISLEEKEIKYSVPSIGEQFYLNDAYFEVLYVGSDESDLNDTSIVLKLIYGENEFLFMADASSAVEEEIISKDIEVDLLKVGHHGSEYSSSSEFLSKVSPEYAVISVGENNSYNHPTPDVLTRLKNNNVKIYRTDESGTILVTSDGKNLSFNTIFTNIDG